MSFLFVGLGGGLGAMVRYGISLLPYSGEFPLLTLLTNFIGAVLIGFIAGLSAEKGISENVILFLKTGVCGGFTTFSTFSLEAYQLYKCGSVGMSVVYSVFSVILCVLGVSLGMLMSKGLVK